MTRLHVDQWRNVVPVSKWESFKIPGLTGASSISSPFLFFFFSHLTTHVERWTLLQRTRTFLVKPDTQSSFGHRPIHQSQLTTNMLYTFPLSLSLPRLRLCSVYALFSFLSWLLLLPSTRIYSLYSISDNVFVVPYLNGYPGYVLAIYWSNIVTLLKTLSTSLIYVISASERTWLPSL